MNIDWSELPKEAVCLISHSDFSGLQLCFIDQVKGLCQFDGGDEVSLVSQQLIAINPNVSLKEFGEAAQRSDYDHIKRLHKIIEGLKDAQ